MSTISHTEKLFYNCQSLLYLPDISKWNVGNVKDMSYMFYNCRSLLSLPDIQNGILAKSLLWKICFIIAIHYHLYQIYQNGIFIMQKI